MQRWELLLPNGTIVVRLWPEKLHRCCAAAVHDGTAPNPSEHSPCRDGQSLSPYCCGRMCVLLPKQGWAGLVLIYCNTMDGLHEGPDQGHVRPHIQSQDPQA